MTMPVELKLVQEIEKYECLYNHKLPEYSRKEVTEKAWTEVAKIAEISVTDCKEKWRNIRSSLVRSIKTLSSGSKSRKPYYLADSLQFVLPYIKPLNYVENPSNPSLDDVAADETTNNEVSLTDESQNENIRSLHSEIPDIQSTLKDSKLIPSQVSYSRCPNCHYKRHYSEDNKTETDYKFRNVYKKQRTGSTDDKMNAMWHFMMSLCPEFETLTEAQLRTIKIKILMFIDEIKSSSKENSATPSIKPIQGLPPHTLVEPRDELKKEQTSTPNPVISLFKSTQETMSSDASLESVNEIKSEYASNKNSVYKSTQEILSSDTSIESLNESEYNCNKNSVTRLFKSSPEILSSDALIESMNENNQSLSSDNKCNNEVSTTLSG